MGKGLAIVGLILTILGLILSFLSILPFVSIIALVLAVAGLILAVVGGKKLRANNLKKGVATAGLVIGILAVVFSGIGFVTCGACQICVVANGNDIQDVVDYIMDEGINEDSIEDLMEMIGDPESMGGSGNMGGNDAIIDPFATQTPAENNAAAGEVEMDMSGLIG